MLMENIFQTATDDSKVTSNYCFFENFPKIFHWQCLLLWPKT